MEIILSLRKYESYSYARFVSVFLASINIETRKQTVRVTVFVPFFHLK